MSSYALATQTELRRYKGFTKEQLQRSIFIPVFILHKLKPSSRIQSPKSVNVSPCRTIWRLSTSLIAVYCKNTDTYGILSETARSVKYVTCRQKVTTCVHVSWYKSNATEQGFTLPIRTEMGLRCISSQPVPYPLKESDKEVFEKYTVHGSFPRQLIPDYSQSNLCEHGYRFNEGDPVDAGWIANAEATTITKHASAPVVTYYRPTTGKCSCRQYYDGRRELLLNLDNRRIFPYNWLFDILHDTQETRYLLAAAFRSANRTRTVCGQGPLLKYEYDQLRVAYNCFLRLLDMDFELIYHCDTCKDNVDYII